MQVQFSPVFGFVQASSWTECVCDVTGKAYFCISLSGEKAIRYRTEFSALLSKSKISSALDLHQACQEVVTAAERGHFQIELVAGFFDFAEHRCSVSALGGKVFLKRAQKVGQILEASNQIQIIEGKLQLDDMFVLVLDSAADSIPLLEKPLATAKSFSVIESDVSKVLKSTQNSETQPALVALHMTEGDQAEPPVTAGQVIANGDDVTPEMSPIEPATQPGAKSSPFSVVGPIFKSIGQSFFAFFSKDVYVRRRATKRLLTILIPLIIIAIALTTFIIFQSRKRQEEIDRAQTIIQPIEMQLSQIKEKISSNPLQARQEAEDLIVQLDLKIKQESTHKATVAELQKELAKVKNYYGTISGLEEFPALQPFYDLRLVKSDFLANRMDLQDKTLVFLDSGQGKIIALDTDKKQFTDIPVGEAAQMKDIELQGSYAYVIGNGLYRLNLSDSKDVTQLQENNDLIQNATGMRLYQQYIYVISVAQNNIFRYSPDEKDKTKLSEPIGWLHQPVTFDLNELQSFAIDGDLWIGTKTGEIKKFTTGTEANYSITGMKETLANPITIYTKEDDANLYVLEPTKERLVVLGKTGEFVKEVKSPTFATATSLVANEKTKKAYVLSGALVFQVDL